MGALLHVHCSFGIHVPKHMHITVLRLYLVQYYRLSDYSVIPFIFFLKPELKGTLVIVPWTGHLDWADIILMVKILMVILVNLPSLLLFTIMPRCAILSLCSAQKFTAIGFPQMHAVSGPPQCPALGHCVLTLFG